MPKRIPNTVMRNGVYHFKKRVPVSCRDSEVFGGKEFVQRSLGTASYDIALRRMSASLRDFDESIRLAEASLRREGVESPSLDPTSTKRTRSADELISDEVIFFHARRHRDAIVRNDARYRENAGASLNGLDAEWLNEWDGSILEQHMASHYESLTKRDVRVVRDYAVSILDREGFERPEEHPQFVAVCNRLIEAEIDAYRTIFDHHRKGRHNPPPEREWLRHAPESHPIRDSTSFSDVFEAFEKTIECGADWSKKIKLAVETFAERHGDLPVERVEKAHVRQWVEFLLTREAYATQRKDHSERVSRISASTIRGSYLAALRRLLHHAVLMGVIETNPAEGVKVPGGRNQSSRSRAPFSRSELNKLLREPIFTGCKSNVLINQPGQVLLNDHRYWAPLLALFTGARASEIAQLTLDRVHLDGRFPFFEIDADEDDENGSIKTQAAHRIVPVHPKLIELGLPDYVCSLVESDERRLFPEWKRSKTKRYSDCRSQRNFNEKICPRIADGSRPPSFHSFRHFMKGELARNEVPLQMQNFILGHEQTGMDRTYLHQPNAEDLTPFIQRLKFEGIELEHLLPENRKAKKS